jgi:hypothetical protein
MIIEGAREMTALLFPFPMARRVGSIRKMAELVAYCRTPESVANTIDSQTNRQAAVMRRHGISEDVIAHEIKAFTDAVWRERTAFIVRCRQKREQQGA